MKYTVREKPTTSKIGMTAANHAARMIHQCETRREAEETALKTSDDHPENTYEIFELGKGLIARYMGGSKLIISMRPKPL